MPEKFTWESNQPDLYNNACLKAEGAFLAYCLCSDEIPVHRIGGLFSFNAIQKQNFGYETKLCMSGSHAGWIMRGGNEFSRPLYAKPPADLMKEVSEGQLYLMKKVPEPAHALTILNAHVNYVGVLFATFEKRNLEFDKKLFMANVTSYTNWLDGQLKLGKEIIR